MRNQWMRMTTVAVAVAAGAVALTAGEAEAGPFGRRSVTTTRATACVGGTCNTSSVRTVDRGPRNGIGAQQHAEAMASAGRRFHTSPDETYEGVGDGPTPKIALAQCCSNGHDVIDQGVARSRNGQWYACRRYAR